MEFRQMKYILTLAETRNMTRAAEKLYISQPALSHYLKCVEDELGAQLFDRSTAPMSLTYAGRCYVERARAILLENEQLKRQMRDITQHMSGKLTIGTSRDRASYMMPRILPEFAALYPGIEIEVYTASGKKLFEELRTGRVDMVLLPLAGQDDLKGLSSELIYSEELVLAARAGRVADEDRIPGKNAVKSDALNNAEFFLLFPEHAMRSFCNRYFQDGVFQQHQLPAHGGDRDGLYHYPLSDDPARQSRRGGGILLPRPGARDLGGAYLLPQGRLSRRTGAEAHSDRKGTVRA